MLKKILSALFGRKKPAKQEPPRVSPAEVSRAISTITPRASSRTVSGSASRRDDDDILGNPLHPLNPISPISQLNPASPLNSSSSDDDYRSHSPSISSRCDDSSGWGSSDSSSYSSSSDSSSSCSSSSSSDY